MINPFISYTIYPSHELNIKQDIAGMFGRSVVIPECGSGSSGIEQRPSWSVSVSPHVRTSVQERKGGAYPAALVHRLSD
jgi:hypothetical protein